MKKLNWYVAMFWDDTENDYFQSYSDEEAIRAFDEDMDNLCELYACNDDETLSPKTRIFPTRREE